MMNQRIMLGPVHAQDHHPGVSLLVYETGREAQEGEGSYYMPIQEEVIGCQHTPRNTWRPCRLSKITEDKSSDSIAYTSDTRLIKAIHCNAKTQSSKPTYQHHCNTKTQGSKPASQHHSSVKTRGSKHASQHHHSVKTRGSKHASQHHHSVQTRGSKPASQRHSNAKTKSSKPTSSKARRPRLAKARSPHPRTFQRLNAELKPAF